jgi:hypothetical protein
MSDFIQQDSTSAGVLSHYIIGKIHVALNTGELTFKKSEKLSVDKLSDHLDCLAESRVDVGPIIDCQKNGTVSSDVGNILCNYARQLSDLRLNMHKLLRLFLQQKLTVGL